MATNCDCCGKPLTKNVYINEDEAMIICSRCYSWKPYGEIPFKRIKLEDFHRIFEGKYLSVAMKEVFHA